MKKKTEEIMVSTRSCHGIKKAPYSCSYQIKQYVK
jgi:hypothetical protein